MAQGDLFSRLVQTGGILDDALSKSIINANQHAKAMDVLQNAQINIYNTRKKMLKADTDSLNVLKRMQSVHNKVYTQMKKNKQVKDDILNTEDKIRKIEDSIVKYRKQGNQEMVKINTSIRNQLKLKNEVNKVQLEQMRKTIPLIGKLSGGGGAFADALVGAAGTIGTIFKVLGTIVGGVIKLGSVLVKMLLVPLKKAFNIFLEMQSTVGNLAADIGLTAIESRALLNNFASLTLSAMKFGGSMKDVATVIQQFSEVTGKNRFFNEREIEQLVKLGLGTGLGVQGASELAASFDNIGLSLEKTIDLTDKARNMSAKMNLNVTKVLKTYQGLVQSLTGIGFGKGLDNLTKLAAKATAIRFDIVKSTEAFADAFFDPEKAVEASARMQVLGGRFAQSFGDPMQLAFESMTDPTALAEKFANTVSAIVAKDSKGNYFIPPAERKTLKLAAEALGQSYEDATASAIEQAKIADKMSALVKSGVSLSDFGEEDKLALAGLMQLNEKGKFEIKMPDGTLKLLENMTDKSQLKQIIDSRKSNEQAAIQRLNMMQRFENVVNRFMMGFSKVFDQLFGGTNFESFLQMVENAGEKISQFIVKDLLGDGGLADGFNIFIDKAKNVFAEVKKIFENKDGFYNTIGQKLVASFKIIFSGFMKPLVSEILSFVAPIFKAGIGKLLEIIGSALPKWLGGNKIKNAGINMQAEAIAKSDTLKNLYGGENAQSELIANKASKQVKDDILNTEDKIRKIEDSIVKYRKQGNQEMVKINTSIRNQLKLENEVNKVQLEQMRQAEAIAKSDTLKNLYGGENAQSELIANKASDGGGSFAQGAGLYGKALYQATKVPGGLVQLARGAMSKTLGKGALETATAVAKKSVERDSRGRYAKKSVAKETATAVAKKSVAKETATAVAKKSVAKQTATALTKTGYKFGLKTLGLAMKRIPVLGALASAGFAINDILEGDFAGAGLNALSGLANLGNIFVPGVGSAVSLGIDGLNAAREMGAFEDGVIYKDGSYAKFNKGDMVQFIDQAAMERAGTGSNSSGSSNTLQHSGVITIKSDDGKVVTWDQMYGSRDLIGSRMDSISESYGKGFGNYQNPYKSPIQPLL